MVEKTYTITNDSGIHARPSTVLVSSVTPFESEVTLEYKGRQINLKSIMGVMSLGITKGASIKVTANGADEEKVIEAVDEVIKKENLGE